MIFSVFPFFLFIYIIAEKWKNGKSMFFIKKPFALAI